MKKESEDQHHNGGLRRAALIRRQGASAWSLPVFWGSILFAVVAAFPASADVGLPYAINQAAMHGLDDSNLVFKDKQVWLYGVQTNGSDTKMGKYGCAKVVSVTLRQAGVDIPVLLGVAGIETKLKKWKRIESKDGLLPGDVVIWVSRFKGNKNEACTGSGTCHVGIYSDKGYFHNNPLGNRPIFNGTGLRFGYKFKYGLRPPNPDFNRNK